MNDKANSHPELEDHGRESGDNGIEEALAEYVDRLNAGDRLSPDEILFDHPTWGDVLLERLEAYASAGRSPEGPLAAELELTLGDFTLRREIGRGGMGIVYDAWQNSMDRQVALKLLPVGVAADHKAFHRFMREAKTAGQLDHPNIVSVHALGMDDNTPYYSMEYVEGQTLAQINGELSDAQPEEITDFGRKDCAGYFENLAAAFAEVADGLQHAHSKGVSHRDVKPSNLILDTEGRLRILDFGLAHLEGHESLTASGDVVGTPLYMSPEQARRRKVPIDHRTDIYSLGATMYEILTERPPFKGKDHEDTLSQIIGREPVELRKVNPRVPKDLETIVLKCLRKVPGDRYGTAEALAQELRRFVRGDPIEARPQTTWERLRRRASRQKERLAVVAVMVLLILLSAVLGYREWDARWEKTNEEYRAAVLDSQMILYRARMVSRVDPALGPGLLMVLDEPHENPTEVAIGKLEMWSEELASRYEASYYLAQALLLGHRREQASDALNTALDREGEFVPALALLAEVEPSSSASEQLAELSASSDEDDWRPWWIAAYRAQREARWGEAASSYARLLELEREAGKELYLGSSIEFRMARGLANLRAGEFRRAAEDFTIARNDLGPEFMEPVLLLGKTHYLWNHPEEAESIFRELHMRQEHEAAPWITQLYITLGDCEKSIHWAGKIERRDSSDSRPERLLAFAYGYCEIEEGRKAMEAAIDRNPRDVGARAMLTSLLLWKQGFRDYPGRERDVDRAIRECQEIVTIREDYAPAYAYLAVAYKRQGKTRLALDACEKARKIHPFNWPTVSSLLLVYASLGLHDECRAYAETLLARKSDLATRSRACALTYRAGYRYLDGDLDGALADNQTAFELDPITLFAPRNSAFIHRERGDLEKAVESLREVTNSGGFRAHKDGPYAILAESLLSLGRPEEAITECCRAILTGPRDVLALRGLAELLRLNPQATRVTELSSVVEKLEERLRSTATRSVRGHIARTLAFLELRLPETPNIENAKGYLSVAVDAGLARDAEFLATLAEVHRAAGEVETAITTLEEALRLPGAGTWHGNVLEECRGEIFPDFVSFPSVDAALASQSPDEDLDLLEAFRAKVRGSSRELCEEYLKGRIAQRAGDSEEAKATFLGLVEATPAEPLVHLRYAENRAKAGEPEAAEEHLRQLLAAKLRGERELWNAWFSLCLDTLALSPRETLDRLSILERAADKTDLSSGEPSYASDLLWLLGRLEENSPIRINCGRGDHRNPFEARGWGRDRFFVGGSPDDLFLEVRGHTTDVPVFKRYRSWRPGRYRGGYRIPLPRGTYRLRLHLYEERDASDDVETYHVLVEGESGPERRQGAIWLWARCDTEELDVTVEDGSLDISFDSRAKSPHIAAIEILAGR